MAFIHDERKVALAVGVIAPGSSAAVQVPAGNKTFYAEVIGTGAVAAVVKVYGGIDASGVNGILLATITLTDTTRDQDAAATSTAPWSYYYAVVESLTGTGATVNAYAMY